MSIVFLMCGLTFSGKTTVAKRIASEFDCDYLSLDDINDERGLWGGHGIPVEEWERTHEIALTRLRERLDQGGCVVVDDTNNLRWLRDRFRAVADEGDHDVVLVHVTAPLEEIRERMAQAGPTEARRSVSDEVFERHVELFEEPGTDESPVVYRSGENVHELLEVLQRTALPLGPVGAGRDLDQSSPRGSLDRSAIALHRMALTRPEGAAPIGVYGPHGWVDGTGVTAPWRLQDDDPALVAQELTDGHDYQVGAVVLEARHTDHAVETFGVRIESDSGVIGYTADSVPCQAVVEIGREADVFLCEAAARTEDSSLHMSPAQAGEGARRPNLAYWC